MRWRRASRRSAGRAGPSLIAAILTSEPPPIVQLQPMTPPALERVVKKCLAKDPDERWQSASDLASELNWIIEGGGHTASTAVPWRGGKKTREALAWLVSGALIVILIVGAIWWRNSKSPEQTMYFSTPFPFPVRDMSLAPNGHTLAAVAYLESARKNVIWIYELGAPNANSLADTEGASYPFWSADGRSLAFFADGKLKKLGVSSGQVQTISDAPSGRGGTWNKDGVIVFTPDAALGAGLYRVSASGGTPTPITKPDTSRGEQSHRWPMFLPDGKHYLYLAANFGGRKGGTSRIFVGALDSNEKHFVVEATANASYAAPGYLLFPREKTLLAQRFDLKRFALTGEPITILTEISYQQLVRRAGICCLRQRSADCSDGRQRGRPFATRLVRSQREGGGGGEQARCVSKHIPGSERKIGGHGQDRHGEPEPRSPTSGPMICSAIAPSGLPSISPLTRCPSGALTVHNWCFARINNSTST